MLKNTQQIAVMAVRTLSTLSRVRVIKVSRGLKKMAAITALVIVMILAGNSVSAQLNSSLSSLNKVEVPKPDNIQEFIKDKTAAIALGKTLFWDMQIGSDGIQACASCHFNAGADSRSKNQINPGSGNTFDIASTPNYQLKPSDFPFHKLEDPNDSSSRVVSDVNDVAGSQGVFRAKFIDVEPGSDKDKTTPLKDEVFNVNNVNVRRVTSRNTPTVINSVFNFRNFWDGRAQTIFNGVNTSGLRDPNAFVLQAQNRRRLRDVQVKINNSSLASQAVGPIADSVELSAEVEPVISPSTVELSESQDQIEIRDRQGRTINRGPATEGIEAPAENELDRNGRGRRLPRRSTEGRRPRRPKPIFRSVGRKLGKKMLALTPLNKQIVANDDSVLGRLSKFPQSGLNKSYEEMIQQAFQRQWWDSNIIIRVDPETGRRSFRRKRRRRPLSTDEFTLAEYNFALFFGLAVQEYESTLISDQTPFDRFLAKDQNALTSEQQDGWEIFQNKGQCINCHVGSELTSASASNVASQQRIARTAAPNNPVGDTGLINIGVRPVTEDLGVGAKDEFDNPLSEARLALQGTFKQLLGEEPPIIPESEQDITADGAFKTPGLRNVELTAPYFHNGGQMTLEQVVEFYNRGGDFGRLPPLGLTDEEKQSLVSFMKSLTDERVRNQKAPFDHPQLFIPNGHPNDEKNVVADSKVQTDDGTKQGKDDLIEIPVVGRGGSKPLPKFLEG